MSGRAMRALVAGLVTVSVLAPAAAADPLRVRKDAKVLTAREKANLVGALHALKAADYPYDDDPDGIGWYDQLVQWHVELTPCGGLPHDQSGIWAHGGPMFLPWHRQYLLMLEDALRAVSGKHVTLPYWDWTDDASTAAVLAEDLMGGTGNPDRGGRLESGPFSYDRWRLNVDNSSLLLYRGTSTRWITRAIGSAYQETLPPASDVAFALARPVYDAAPWGDNSDARVSFRMALEGIHDNHDPLTGGDGPIVKGCSGPVAGKGGITAFGSGTLHNSVHGYVGGMTGTDENGTTLLGTMSVPLASPNDPIFFLHHANVDRLWAQWQKAHRDDPYRPRGPSAGEAFPDNEIDDPMRPWPQTPRDVADIEALGYAYAEPGSAKPKGRARRSARRGGRPPLLLCRLRRL